MIGALSMTPALVNSKAQTPAGCQQKSTWIAPAIEVLLTINRSSIDDQSKCN
jgi:hypothetical protein